MIRSTRRWRGTALLALGALTGGTVLLSAGSAEAKPEFAITRVFGNDRAATAAAIATDTFSSGADLAIIVREDDFPDALAGNYLAGQFNAPILLASHDAVSTETIAALTTLGVDAVTLLGGTTALGAGVENAIKAALPAVQVSRIAGTTRFDTAQRVALAPSIAQPPKAVGQLNGENIAVLSSGINFPDALSAGPMVFSQHFPQLLTETNVVSAGVIDTLKALNIDRVLLTGGTVAISANVEQTLTGAGIAVTRIFGDTRYATSRALAVFEGTNFGYSAAHVNFATGINFPDALAGGPHAGTEKAAILLTPNSTGADFDGLCTALGQLATTLTSADVFGGTVAVSDAVVNGLTDCGKGTAPAGGTGQIVDFDTAANTYTFVQDSDDAVITVNYDDQDTFTVGGASSTVSNFETHLSAGDRITFTDDATATDADKHELTDATVTSGLVGEVDIVLNTFSIINDVTGTRVGGPFTYNEASDQFGTTPAVFEGNINEGDTVTVAEDPDTHVKTITLNAGAIEGTVTEFGILGPNVAFTVDDVFGDQFDASGIADTVFVASSAPATGTEAYTVGGQAKNFADFAAAISVGDTISVSRSGNVETFALTNAAPPVQTGQAIDNLDTAADTFDFVTADGQVVSVDYTAITAIQVNGANATAADLEAKYTPGDTITFQAGDAPSSTTVSLKLQDAPLQGQIANIDAPNTEYDVMSVNNHEVLATVDYTAGPAPQYFINGNDAAHEVTQAAFETKLGQLDFAPAPAELDDLIQVIPTTLHIQHVLTSDDT